MAGRGVQPQKMFSKKVIEFKREHQWSFGPGLPAKAAGFGTEGVLATGE
jgi:hypothetical protein